MHFALLGLSHKTTPVDIREKFSLSEEEVRDFLKNLRDSDEVEEAFLISTCNRVEIYITSKHHSHARERVIALLAQKGNLRAEALHPYLYEKESEDALRHLFRVTSGLDSMIVGEPQIAGQVKEAYRSSIEAETTGTYLNKVVHQALHVAKKIRTETEIGRHPVSVSYAAVLLAEKIFGNLSQKKVLLVGLGDMGELTARHLVEKQVHALWIANRSEEKAENLSRELAAHLLPFRELERELQQFDIIIVSTGAPDYVIHKEALSHAMQERKNSPMFLIDISVPRNIDPAIHQIENVYLYDIDHLKGIVENNFKEREKEAKKAEMLIEGEVDDFSKYLRQRAVSPTIERLSKKFEGIREAEIEKHLKRSKLSPEDREAVEACTRSIVNKILHDPILSMKTESTKEGTPRYPEILRKLFNLDGEGDDS